MIDEPATAEGLKPPYDWDFFLAHAGADLEVAKNLKESLEPPARVFLDAVNIQLGDDWDERLSEAQRSSLISVVIVSPNTKKAYYQREEIAAALQMAREDPDTHRVIPLYLSARQIPPGEIPYGLRLKHSLQISKEDEFPAACRRLLETLEVMRRYEVKKDEVVARQRKAIAKITGGDGGQGGLLAGFSEVTSFVRPLLKTLLALFVLMVALLVVCLLLPGFEDVRGLLAAVFGGLCALLLASMLWLSARSLKFAQQIAEGRLNGG
jgi:TIR domain